MRTYFYTLLFLGCFVFQNQAHATVVTKSDTLSKTSKPFTVNKIKCYWKLTLIVPDSLSGGFGTLQLKNYKTQKTLMSNEDYYSLSSYNTIDFNQNRPFFKDVNFDGYTDYVAYSNEDSGSGGDFYKVYLFHTKTQTFKYSKALSGGNLESNIKKKTLSSSWRTSVKDGQQMIYHFTKGGKVSYVERITSDTKPDDTLVTEIYEKISNGKVVEKKTSRTY